jgi:alpha-D-xyloside xylohydrolase
LWLPPGDWVDIWTGERLSGPARVERPAPLDTIPVFLRAGSLVPLAAPGIDTLAASGDPEVVSYLDVPETDVWVVPGDEPKSLTLFNGLVAEYAPDADGFELSWSTTDVDPGVDARIAFSPSTVEFQVEGAGVLADGASAVTVTRNGMEMDLPQGQDCDECWDWDAARTTLKIRLSSPGSVAVRR